MKKLCTGLTALNFLICLLVAVKTYGQRNIYTSYCLGCCGLNAYQLILFDDQSFEIRSSDEVYKTPYVRGRYALTPKAITLDIESVRERVEIKKIKESESLILHLDIVIDTDELSIPGVSVLFKKSPKRGFTFSQSGEVHEVPFDISKTLLFRFMGMNTVEYSFTEPGEYMMKVTMIVDMKMMLKAGDQRTFKRIKSGKEEKLRDSTDKTIKFVTKRCEPIIL